MQVRHTRAINCTVARYNHILTFTKLATYSASVVKSDLGGLNPFYTPVGTRLKSVFKSRPADGHTWTTTFEC